MLELKATRSVSRQLHGEKIEKLRNELTTLGAVTRVYTKSRMLILLEDGRHIYFNPETGKCSPCNNVRGGAMLLSYLTRGMTIPTY